MSRNDNQEWRIHCNWIREYALRYSLERNKLKSTEDVLFDAKKFENYMLNKKDTAILELVIKDDAGN